MSDISWRPFKSASHQRRVLGDKPPLLDRLTAHPFFVGVAAALAGAVATYYLSPDSTFALQLSETRITHLTNDLKEANNLLKEAYTERAGLLLNKTNAERDISELTAQKTALASETDLLRTQNKELRERNEIYEARSKLLSELHDLDRYVSENIVLQIGKTGKLEDGHSTIQIKAIKNGIATLNVDNQQLFQSKEGQGYTFSGYTNKSRYDCAFHVEEVKNTEVKMWSTCKYTDW